jgi:hypothetical protein
VARALARCPLTHTQSGSHARSGCCCVASLASCACSPRNILAAAPGPASTALHRRTRCLAAINRCRCASCRGRSTSSSCNCTGDWSNPSRTCSSLGAAHCCRSSSPPRCHARPHAAPALSDSWHVRCCCPRLVAAGSCWMQWQHAPEPAPTPVCKTNPAAASMATSLATSAATYAGAQAAQAHTSASMPAATHTHSHVCSCSHVRGSGRSHTRGRVCSHARSHVRNHTRSVVRSHARRQVRGHVPRLIPTASNSSSTAATFWGSARSIARSASATAARPRVSCSSCWLHAYGCCRLSRSS